jgi:hypothetical protein
MGGLMGGIDKVDDKVGRQSEDTLTIEKAEC